VCFDFFTHNASHQWTKCPLHAHFVRLHALVRRHCIYTGNLYELCH
jgi:hypothetical protein